MMMIASDYDNFFGVPQSRQKTTWRAIARRIGNARECRKAQMLDNVAIYSVTLWEWHMQYSDV